MFFFAGVVFRPPAFATGTFSDGSGVARHFLPLPRAHRRFIDDFLFTMLHDGAVHPPKSQKPTFTARCSFSTLRCFPRFPKTKGPAGARNRKLCSGLFRDFGLNSEAAFPPGVWVLMAFTSSTISNALEGGPSKV